MSWEKLILIVAIVGVAIVLFFRPNAFTFKEQDISVWREYEASQCEIFVIHCASIKEGLALFESKHPELLVVEYLFKDGILWIKAVRK